MATEASTDVAARVAATVAPVAAELDIELLDVEVSEGRQSVVRLVVDVAVTEAGEPVADGIDVDRIAELSRRAGELLDELDPVAAAYTLEVSSPGTDRPLSTWRDFARNRGRTVRIVPVGGDEPFEGTVTEARPERVVVTTAAGARELALGTIERATVVLPW